MEGAKRLTRDLINEGCVSMNSCPYTLFIYVVVLFEHTGPEFVRSLENPLGICIIRLVS